MSACINCDFLDPWEVRMRDNLRGARAVPWSDQEAWVRYPKHRWVYDKLMLSRHFGVGASHIDGEENDFHRYPVFVKKRRNLNGMGQGAYLAQCEADLPMNNEGMFAQEFLKGEHLSTDILIHKDITSCYSFKCHKDEHGSFTLFESNAGGESGPVRLANILREEGFSGIINVETIDGKIIEAHLRPALQFADICGGFLQESLDVLNGVGVKNFEYPDRDEIGYSRVYRLPYDATLKETPYFSAMPLGVRSVHKCWHEDLPLSVYVQDENSYRYLIINGTDLNMIDMLGKNLHKHIKIQNL